MASSFPIVTPVFGMCVSALRRPAPMPRSPRRGLSASPSRPIVIVREASAVAPIDRNALFARSKSAPPVLWPGSLRYLLNAFTSGAGAFSPRSGSMLNSPA